jgi:hypothetical protein
VDVKSKMDKLRAKETSINNRLSIINSELNNIPNTEHVKQISKWACKVIANSTKHDPRIIFKRSYEWRRKLIEKAFSGVNPSGQRLGIYVDMINVKSGFTFEIRGIFENTVKALPLSDFDLMETFHLDPEYQDIPQELEKIRKNIISNMPGKSDAYHSQCFHK